jgi:hypothetical protein
MISSIISSINIDIFYYIFDNISISSIISSYLSYASYLPMVRQLVQAAAREINEIRASISYLRLGLVNGPGAVRSRKILESRMAT